MQNARLIVCSLVALAPLSLLSLASRAETDLQKSYPLHGKPSLSLSTGDSSLEVQSCGTCSAVQVRVQWNDRKSSDYTLTEFQSGNSVTFTLKKKPGFGMHIHVGNRREPHVYVQSPAVADVEARTADGSLKLSGLQGNLTLHTSDGSMDVSDVSGALRLTASDGSIRIHNASGTIESHSSDGHATIDGRFSALEIRSSDGGLDLTLDEGSRLTAPSHIQSSDGPVKVRVPASLAADLEVATSDGSVDCQLPLSVNSYNSKHQLHGHLNGGGPSFTIHTSDGNVTIGRL